MSTAADPTARRLALLREGFAGRVAGRTVVLGIGNPLCGDDALGCETARLLRSRGCERALVCEDVPENYTGEVKRFNPREIILVDAVDFSAEPGDVILLGREEVGNDRFNTHKPALGLLMHYLAAETGAEVVLVGIQPKNRALQAPISPEVRESIEHLALLLADALLPAEGRLA
jgi:hydrogenase 3 maturation protease